jgi:hypothetical protein
MQGRGEEEDKRRRGKQSKRSRYDRNFPCQTLKIRKVSLVVMGS